MRLRLRGDRNFKDDPDLVLAVAALLLSFVSGVVLGVVLTVVHLT